MRFDAISAGVELTNCIDCADCGRSSNWIKGRFGRRFNTPEVLRRHPPRYIALWVGDICDPTSPVYRAVSLADVDKNVLGAERDHCVNRTAGSSHCVRVVCDLNTRATPYGSRPPIGPTWVQVLPRCLPRAKHTFPPNCHVSQLQRWIQRDRNGVIVFFHH